MNTTKAHVFKLKSSLIFNGIYKIAKAVLSLLKLLKQC